MDQRGNRYEGDNFQEDPRVVVPFNGMSPSGDVEAEAVYANYGTPEDFAKLEQLKVDVRGKIVLVRYGQNFRGVKEFIAQERGAAAVLIYSDPYDDGWRRGDKYPRGPWRPDTGVQRGSVGCMFQFPGDPTTPGIASLPSLPDSQRIPPEKSEQLPKIPVTPISYADAWPILEHLAGPDSPRDWQGSLPFTYHLGPGPVKVHVQLKQDFQFRTIWDVIGRIPGSQWPDGGWLPVIIGTPGSMARLTLIAEPQRCLRPCTGRGIAQGGMEAEADADFWQLGRGGRRTYRLHRVG